MTKEIIVLINAMLGVCKVSVMAETTQTFELTWREQPNGDFGFVTDFHERPIRLTEVSAQVFIENFVDIIRHCLGDCVVTILNDRGETLPEVQFLPPTFEGGTDDILDLVERQESLKQMHLLFETTHRRLTADLLNACHSQNILEDFLTIIESKLCGIRFALTCINSQEN